MWGRAGGEGDTPQTLFPLMSSLLQPSGVGGGAGGLGQAATAWCA